MEVCNSRIILQRWIYRKIVLINQLRNTNVVVDCDNSNGVSEISFKDLKVNLIFPINSKDQFRSGVAKPLPGGPKVSVKDVFKCPLSFLKIKFVEKY